jgi:hypothetical protein
MSDPNSQHSTPPGKKPTKRGLWRWVRGIVVSTDSNFAFVKNLTLVGAFGTVFVALLQYQSAYQDKEASLAKDDLAVATQTFNDVLTRLSVVISLQQRLISGFYAAAKKNVYKSDDAYLTKEARAIYKQYSDAYSDLTANSDLFAERLDMYIDGVMNTARDQSKNVLSESEVFSISDLGALDFDCESDMPSFDQRKTKLVLKKFTETAVVDWNKTKDHLLTILYCAKVTHEFIIPVLQWASQSTIDEDALNYFTNEHNVDHFMTYRIEGQQLRLRVFILLSGNDLEQIRARYQLKGLVCGVPIV